MLSSIADMPIWDFIWRRNQYFEVADKLCYRTRVVQEMQPQGVINEFIDLAVAKGTIEIQRVLQADPRIANETGQIGKFELNLACKSE